MTLNREFNAVQGRFEVDLGTKHHFTDGVYAKEMHLPAGYKAYSHQHSYSHFGMLAKGAAIVRTDEGSTTYNAPAIIEIMANTNHEITALRDVTWFCIHATQETDEDKVDQVLLGE